MKSSDTGDQSRPDLARRRLARGGLAGTAVLGSLISQPVLGAVPYHCTISGKMSGNTSRAPDSTDCHTLGRSPGYWKNKPFPTGLVAGSLPTVTSGQCNFNDSYSSAAKFGGFTVQGSMLANAFTYGAVNGQCVALDPNSPGYGAGNPAATMLQVLWSPGGLNDTMTFALGRATVASLLNSFMFAPTYPLSPKQVIEMFNAVYLGGLYQIPNSNPAVFWNRDQVKTYFESLYGNL